MDEIKQLLFAISSRLDNIEVRISDLENQSDKNEKVLNKLKAGQNDVRTALIDFTEEIEKLHSPRFPVNNKRKNEEENN